MSAMDYLRSLASPTDQQCAHAPSELATPSGQACEECGSTHSLRMCASCGHELMVSMPVGSGFTWCYAHDRYLG